MLSLSIIISAILYYCESAGRSYYIIASPFRGDGANQACINAGYQLATVVDQADKNAVYAAFLNQGISTSTYGFWWIGLIDKATEGQWLWRDGTPCTTNDGNCIDYFNPSAFSDSSRSPYLDCALVRNIGTSSFEAWDWDCTTDYYPGSNEFGAICQDTPTSDPTMSPTEKCEPGTGYSINGISAYATGDPHFV